MAQSIHHPFTAPACQWQASEDIRQDTIKIWGNESYLVSFDLFLELCQEKWTRGKWEDIGGSLSSKLNCLKISQEVVRYG